MIADEILKLELSLLVPPGRTSEAYLRDVVSDEFRELGTSGATYDKRKAIAALVESPPPAAGKKPELFDFRVEEIAPGVALATYRTPLSLRSSIWRREGGAWRLYFHQGTRLP